MTRAEAVALADEIQQSMPTPEWDSVPELKKFKQTVELKSGEKRSLKFDEMVVAYKTLDAEIKFREGKRAAIKEALTTAMLLADVKEVECEGYPVQWITKKGSKKIDAQKLLEHGVDAMTIAECTVVGDESSYVQIGKPKKD